jgi:glutamyl-tRNA synthetase
MPDNILVRFAPSPTGLLHAGNARTAVLNFLFARANGGKFLLRIDDTDKERSTKEYEDAILEDLAWLGVVHDEFARQSAREQRYDEAAAILKSAGKLYACYETPEELERKRKRQQARRLPPVYDRAALELTEDQRAELESQGRKPHWRFFLSRTKVAWDDLVRGHVEIDTSSVSDPVLIRADGSYLYTLPSVVDDSELGVTHVIRGEDHVTNSAAQAEIFQALGSAVPHFAHHPLLVGADGSALSKRLGSLSLRHLRDQGIQPLALATYLAKVGTSDAIEPKASMDELSAEFDFAKIGRAPARFDPAELSSLSAKLLHRLEYDEVRDKLAELDCDLGEGFWEAVRANLAKISDVAELKALVEGPVTPVHEDPELLEKAAELLPEEPFSGESWGAWTKAVSSATGKKGRALYHPLRLALTASDHGPEMAKLLPLIGRARTLSRLKGETA